MLTTPFMPTALTSQPLSASDALSTLLTAESLLFAALSVSVVLGQETERGRALPTSAFSFAACAAGVISLLAVGAGTAWFEAFLDPGNCDLVGWLVAIPIIIAIVAEAAFSWWIAFALKGS